MRRVAAAALAALLAALALASAAAAHTHLVSATSARAGVALRFSEGVEARFAQVRVTDPRGAPVAVAGAPRTRGAELIVPLAARSLRGHYEIAYRVLATDGHVSSGSSTFTDKGSDPLSRADATGKGSDPLPVADSTGLTPVGQDGARALAYAALALAVGALAFMALVGEPALAVRSETDGVRGAARAQATVLAAAAAVAGVVAAGLAVVLLAAEGEGTQPWGVGTGAVGDALATRAGMAHAADAVAWLAALALLVRRAPAGGAAGPPAALAVPLWILTVSCALSAHAAEHGAAIVLAATVHVAAMSIWLGGLVTLLVLARGALREHRRLLLAVTRRFSVLAAACVAVVVLTGVVQSLDCLGSVRDLAATAFGRALLVKLGLFALALAVAAGQRVRVGAGATRAVGGGLAAETALVAGIVVAAGVLAGIGPPSG